MAYSLKETVYDAKTNEIVHGKGETVDDETLHNISMAILAEELYTPSWNFSRVYNEGAQ
jgi:hypothetical protein